MPTISSPAPQRKRRKRRKLRWGRIIFSFILCFGLCFGLWYACSRDHDDAPESASTEAAFTIDEPIVEEIQADDEPEADAEAIDTPADDTPSATQAKSGVDEILAPRANPHLQRLDAMPDDGCVKMKINPIGQTLGKAFNDSNYLHLQAARAIGIDPIENSTSAWRLKRPLVEIETCREYYVDTLKHSYPYLVPEAAALLKDIGQAFNDSLMARGGGSYRLKITSLLRTPLTVGRLRRVNKNATDTSAHQFATTFDISYSKFICDSVTVARTQEDLKNLLAEVLNDFRNQGRCYIKHERKQACFHITTIY